MEYETQLNHLGRSLAGIFQNRQQALAEPAWVVHLRLWSYPVVLFSEDSFTFFIEQASAAFAQPPYRQRLLRVRWSNGDSVKSLTAGNLTAEYYALKQPQLYQGAAQNPERLSTLKEHDLQPLQCGRLRVTSQFQPNAICFQARQYPGERCQFFVNGEARYVELAFDAICPIASGQEQATFLMYDKGIDLITGKAIWGALKEPFRFKKIEDFSSALPQYKFS